MTWAETGVRWWENRGTLTGKFKEGMIEEVSEMAEAHRAGVLPEDTRQQGGVPTLGLKGHVCTCMPVGDGAGQY